MYPTLKPVAAASLLAVSLVAAGCQTPPRGSSGGTQPTVRRSSHSQPTIQRVVCLYDQKPWLNLDTGGDLDPEGIHYRVFLDAGSGRGTHVDGTFHVEMYQIERNSSGGIERTLLSDWHLPTNAVPPIKSAMLGMGYHLQLRWAKKGTAGNEIEIATLFEDPDGNTVRSGTKRLRVPKYGR